MVSKSISSLALFLLVTLLFFTFATACGTCATPKPKQNPKTPCPSSPSAPTVPSEPAVPSAPVSCTRDSLKLGVPHSVGSYGRSVCLCDQKKDEIKCGEGAIMSAIYDEKKDEDGFLYVTYSGENTFGMYV